MAFDKELANQTIQEKFPSKESHYLEKIVQLNIDLPKVSRTELIEATLNGFNQIFVDLNENEAHRFMNHFYEGIAPYLKTPRHVNRLLNIMSITWPLIRNEVSAADFSLLETVRLYEPSLHKNIYDHKDCLVGINYGDRRLDDQDRFNNLLKGVDIEKHETCKKYLQRLFPRLENILYTGEFKHIWNNERRVCIESHFGTYFKYSLGEDVLSTREINSLIKHAGDPEFVKNYLLKASRTKGKNNKSKIPTILNELNSNCVNIEKEKVENFISALFEVADDIDLETDKETGFMSFQNTHTLIHWVIRSITRDRFDIDERSNIYIKALKNSSFDWSINFIRSAIADYEPNTGSPEPEEKCLVINTLVPELKKQLLSRIHKASEDGTLIKSKYLIDHLYKWKRVESSVGETKQFIHQKLNNFDFLIALTKALISNSYSSSLGDHVSKKHTRVSIGNDFELFEVELFKSKLNSALLSDECPNSVKEQIQDFLNIWKNQPKQS